MNSDQFFSYEIGDTIKIGGVTHKFLDFIDRMGRCKLAPVHYTDRYADNFYDSIEEYMEEDGEEDEDGNIIHRNEEDLSEVTGNPFWIDYRDIEEDPE